MASMKKITLSKSLIGRHDVHIKTANSLGLRKIGDVSVQEESEQLCGKLKQISYLITVEEA